MKIEDIYNFLDTLSPFELQAKWDNSGLIIGDFKDNINQIYFSLDLDLDLLKNIKPNSLIITHHPLIFKPLKKINYNSYSTKIIQILIKNNISVISMHTNFDKTHLNKYVGSQILKLNIIDSDEYIAYANVNEEFDSFKNSIAKKLNLKYLKYVKSNEKIKTIALVTGSGASMIDDIKADCFLTADIKYHDAMEAKARGISLIDIRHYESEKYFNTLLFNLCEEYLKINKLKGIITSSENPFSYEYIN